MGIGAIELAQAATPTTTTPGADSTPVTPRVTPSTTATPARGVNAPPNGQSAVQAAQQMFDGVDALLKQVLGDNYKSPADHFVRVGLVAKALKLITDPARRADFIDKLEQLGKPFGINFGLSRVNPQTGKKLNLNDGVFKGIDTDHQGVHEKLLSQYTDGTAATAQPVASTQTPTAAATPVSTASSTPANDQADATKLLAAVKPIFDRHGGKLTKADLVKDTNDKPNDTVAAQLLANWDSIARGQPSVTWQQFSDMAKPAATPPVPTSNPAPQNTTPPTTTTTPPQPVQTLPEEPPTV